MNHFQNRIETIAIKYAELVEKRINTVLEKKEDLDHEVMCEINDGIRMLNHIANALERISRLQQETVAND